MAHKKNTAIEPTRGNVPAMDRPSVAFAWFLDSMVIESEFGHLDSSTTTYLTCNLCAERVCEVEQDDTLRVLLNTALAHTC